VRLPCARRADLNEDTSMLCFRTITGSIILYDHVTQKGAFHKASPIQARVPSLLLFFSCISASPPPAAIGSVK
jgi:hypothetical protein